MNTAVDYRDDPREYEIEELARPDEMLMIEGVRRRCRELLNSRPNARVLDLCCGTGLSLLNVFDHPNVSEAIGVDTCESYLAFAAARFAGSKVRLIHNDAVNPAVDGPFDIIVMASAYHHIEDARKQLFLQNAKRLLAASSRIVMGENILPSYQSGDPRAYSNAVSVFYREVLITARNANPSLPEHVAALIQRVAQYGHDGDYEYKTSVEILLGFLENSSLKVARAEKLWPTLGPLSLTTGGNYVLDIEHA